MPFFLHQWTYKDSEVRAMVTTPQDREEIVSLAAQAFGGRLHGFYFCFGDHDAMCITEFPDNRTALACVMSIVGHRGLVALKTTALVTTQEARDAMGHATRVVNPYSKPSETADRAPEAPARTV